MCEVFGVTANRKVQLNHSLKEFFSHGNVQPNGWGIATFDRRNVSIEKEPIRADRSTYLKSKLRTKICASNMFAHIRRATIGEESYDNTHPFAVMDSSGRNWTLMHNGSIFDAPELKKYQHYQMGTTDSERILLYVVDRINKAIKSSSGNLADMGKYRLIESIVEELSFENKLNLLLFDGENMYVHKNAENTMYAKEERGAVYFSTQPLDNGKWLEVEQNRLLVYRNGELVYTGNQHFNSYVEDPEKMKLLFLTYSNL